MNLELDKLSPREIVQELDKYIIGQHKAKKAVAIAIRNRTRRQRLPDELRDEVAPKNIILIGPTGVGKTEIARRISRLSGAPFIKVEATKYTEVGYVGRDVESMVRDLMHVGINMVKQELQESVRPEARERAVERILDILLGQDKPAAAPASPGPGNILGINLSELAAGIVAQFPGVGMPGALPVAETSPATPSPAPAPEESVADAERQQRVRDRMRQKLLAGELDEKEIEVLVGSSGGAAIEVFSGGSMEELDLNFGGLSSLLGGRKKKKSLPIHRARQVLEQEELDRLVDMDRLSEIARDRVQNMGIIFIDEIDKIASRGGHTGGEVSREGVQRDILPIVEGSQVNTKYGLVDTRHILFIAAGAFHTAKPSDLIPELQGRFPIRVELESLHAGDFLRILTQPANAITRQYIELLATEGVTLTFDAAALELVARYAEEVNGTTENIGARRLQTMMELLLEDISFEAPERRGESLTITADYVRERLAATVGNQDVSRYIL